MFRIVVAENMLEYYASEYYAMEGISFDEDSLSDALKTAEKFIGKGFAVSIEEKGETDAYI